MDELQAADLTAEEARALTDKARGVAAELVPLVADLYRGRAWRALGYESWDAYRRAEFPSVLVAVEARPAAIAELRGAGMSQRETAALIGVSDRTVGRIEDREPDATCVASARQTLMSGGRPYERSAPVPFAGPVVMPEPEARARVAEAIERHLPPDPDDAHREWRRQFLAALGVGRRAMQFDADSVATRADDECVDELNRLSDDLASFVARVASKRPTPDNVRRLKVV